MEEGPLIEGTCRWRMLLPNPLSPAKICTSPEHVLQMSKELLLLALPCLRAVVLASDCEGKQRFSQTLVAVLLYCCNSQLFC